LEEEAEWRGEIPGNADTCKGGGHNPRK
jgi:hypothetical protein